MDIVAAPKAGRREWIGLAVLALPTLLVSLDTFVMLLALPPVATALGATSSEQLWIMDVYGFMVAGFMITMGSLGDRIGRRRLLLASALVFGVASVLAAYANSPELLIGARALLGLAGAAITPCTLSLVMNLFRDPRQQASAIGIWGGCFTVGAVIGPVVGGVLLEHFWWGAVFLIGVPAMVVLLVAGPLLLPEYRDASAGRIDLPSVALSLAGILPLIQGLKQLAASGWGAGPAGFLVVGLVFGWLFLRRQRRLVDPLVDLGLFRKRTFTVTLGSMMTYSMLSGGVMVFVAQYFQLVDGLSPLKSGLALVPGMITSTVSFQVAPLLARWIRPGRLIAGALVFTVVGMGLVAVADSTAMLVVAFAVTCLGVAPLIVLGTNLVVGSVPPEKAGTAAALSQTGNEFGYALGIAVLGSVVTAVYRSGAPSSGGDSLAAALSAGLPDAVLEQARDAFTSGLHVAAVIAAVVIAGMAVLLRVVLRKLPVLGGTDGH
ncbi:DHA2 family multidrug resistance protein-like MFS transporter [Kribbella sp. VKM Ac-2527]|uniref:DHA2 family multidrug resistance protein-like MFS transporter n=1 Tax=Kribbella caucasensis TaxID=2512215 RepID=A0A4R6JLW8_9ACTN|nr:MFS transporter [Kribbella sp. VKM Ac-2527]TDO35696.1 DHA2 family multidrug resistance protein-like MFS transporter [Kribbella sp. VKM Ac-2527]